MTAVANQPNPGMPCSMAYATDASLPTVREFAPVGHARQHPAEQDIEHRTDGQRAQNPARHVASGIHRLLRGRRNRVEADEGEEHDARAAQHAAPSVMVNRFMTRFGRRESASACGSPD